MPPHPERQTASRDESDDAECGVHRLHRHAAIEDGQANQPGSLWRLHPHLQVQRKASKTELSSTSFTKRATSTSGSAPKTKSMQVRGEDQGTERLAERRVEEQV